MTRKAISLSPSRPAFYARTGYRSGDLLALLHAPYTAWHLSYVIYGAVLASELHWITLGGTLVAFFFGTGVAAHALDEFHGHPLATQLSDATLLGIAGTGILASASMAVVGAFVVSPWVLAWAFAGTVLMMGYTLEWHRALHSDLAFAVAWGGFPVLVGYWAQTQRFEVAMGIVALSAIFLSLAQRALSTPARFVRRDPLAATTQFLEPAGRVQWKREDLLRTWERPLKLLSATVVTLAAGLLATRI